MTPATRASSRGAPLPTVVAYVPRPHAKALAQRVIPGRRGRLIRVRSAADLLRVIRERVVDAALVDIGGPTDELWRVAALAGEFPSVPFVALAPLRPSDAPTLARCVSLDFAALLVEGVDDAVADALVAPHFFSTRFVAALDEPPARLGLVTDLQRNTWREIIRCAGRPVRTSDIAVALGVTREHLSRCFAIANAPNLKRTIDFVRLLAAAELAKNPGYDIRDIARVLQFASSSHLALTAQRVVGTRPGSLSALRTIDLVGRFSHARRRSRA